MARDSSSAGGISCACDPMRAHGFITLPCLRVGPHLGEQTQMTGWERAQAVSIVILATLAGIGALYLGRELCIPLALALLLNALLRPVVRSLEHLRVSTAVGATLVSLGLLGVLVAGGGAFVHPVPVWGRQLPPTF